MHDELSIALPEAVFDALDANDHLGTAARAKLQEAFRKSTSTAIFDPAVSAPFASGHQFCLTLAEDAYFDPVKRCSAGPETGSVNDLLKATGRHSILHEYSNHWTKMETQFGSSHELSGTNVGSLWEGVTFVMQARAARALSWNCPEVADACKDQSASLPTYRAAVATAFS